MKRTTFLAVLSRFAAQAALIGGVLSAVATPSVASLIGITHYDTSFGALLGGPNNPTLSGGPFNGQTLGSLSINNIVGERTSGIMVLHDASGITHYDTSFGALLGGPNNPTLSGGPFNGQTLGSLSINNIAGERDTGIMVLHDASGITHYDTSFGALLGGPHNPTLSGGPFNGQTLGSLSINNIVGERTSGIMVLHDASGITHYDTVSGALLGGPNNPTLSGGPFNGKKYGELSINNIAGERSNGIMALFVPEPSSLLLAALGTAALGCAVWRRRAGSAAVRPTK